VFIEAKDNGSGGDDWRYKLCKAPVKSSPPTNQHHLFNSHFSDMIIWISRYQNATILHFIGAKDDGGGGDNWSCKTCKSPVKSSPPTI